MKGFNKIIEDIGEELGIKVTLLSDNWLTILEKNGKIHYIEGHKFDLNNHGIGNIMDDKGLFHDLLVHKNIPVIEQISFYQKYDKDKVVEYFHKNNNILIVKANIGTCGKDVYLVNNEKDLLDKLDLLLKRVDTVSISPYYEIINEYRVIVLNNEEKLVYGKIKPVIIGDGSSSVLELAQKFNSFYQEKEKRIINPNYVPKPNEKIELDFRFNLSNGAMLFTDINQDLKKEIVALALKTAKELNIIFASIDIIHTKDGKLLVLEANSGVMMNNYFKLSKANYQKAYQIYKEAIVLMFK